MIRLLLCLPLALLGLPSTGRAQAFGPYDEVLPAIAAREQAKAALPASQATPRDLARAQLSAAREQLRESYVYYRIGARLATFDDLLEAAERTLRAALALSEKPAERRAALAGYCSVLREAERIVGARYSLGRAGLADYAFAACMRLKGEMLLAGSGARPEELIPLPDEWLLLLSWSVPLDFDRSDSLAEDMARVREKFAAVSTPRLELARERLEAARASFRVRAENYRDGREDASLYLVVKSCEQLRDAELALLDKPADRLAALTRYWLLAWMDEQILEAKYDVGRVSLASFMHVKTARLDAEIKLVEARAQQKLFDPIPTTSTSLIPEANADYFAPHLVLDALLLTKEIAKRQFEVSRTTVRNLALARREAARACQQDRLEMYRAGAPEGTLDLLLEASRRLLEAELPVLDDPVERVAAGERYWELTRIAEGTVRTLYEVGRVSLAGFTGTRYERLDAEMRLAEERAKLKGK
jgi:hypothetical protein